MRSTYGKLIYLLQDSQMPEVKELLEFDCVKPIKTVYNILNSTDCLSLLQDDLVHVATMEITDEGKSRYQIQQEIKRKEKAIKQLSQKYTNQNISEDRLCQCLYSLGDNNAFLRTNRDPCEKMIHYLATK